MRGHLHRHSDQLALDEGVAAPSRDSRGLASRSRIFEEVAAARAFQGAFAKESREFICVASGDDGNMGNRRQRPMASASEASHADGKLGKARRV
jgi:hypothetical protein